MCLICGLYLDACLTGVSLIRGHVQQRMAEILVHNTERGARAGIWADRSSNTHWHVEFMIMWLKMQSIFINEIYWSEMRFTGLKWETHLKISTQPFLELLHGQWHSVHKKFIFWKNWFACTYITLIHIIIFKKDFFLTFIYIHINS